MANRAMKDSGVEYIREVPKSWKVSPLSRLFKIKAGGDAKSELYYDEYDEEHPYPVFTNTNIENKIYAYTSKAFFPANSITVSGRGSIGKAFYRKTPFDAIIRLIVLMEKSELEMKYFAYFISYVVQFNTGSSAVGQLSTLQIAPYRVTVPKLQEQQKIAAFLDEKVAHIDNIIEDTKQSIENLKGYKQSLITETVTKGLDPEVEMKDSGVEWIGKVPKHWHVEKAKYKFIFNKGLSITKENLKTQGIPVINYGEIHSKYGVKFDPENDSVKKVSPDYRKYNNALLKYGDFIFADTSEDIEGSGNFTTFLGDVECFAGYHTVVMKPMFNNDDVFLTYLLDSLTYRRQIQNMVKGIKVYSITQSILKNTYVWLPPEKERKEISVFLDNKVSVLNNMIMVSKPHNFKHLINLKCSKVYSFKK